MFNRRHYEWLARWIADELPNVMKDDDRALVAHHLALELEDHSPVFNRERFLKACNIGD